MNTTRGLIVIGVLSLTNVSRPRRVRHIRRPDRGMVELVLSLPRRHRRFPPGHRGTPHDVPLRCWHSIGLIFSHAVDSTGTSGKRGTP